MLTAMSTPVTSGVSITKNVIRYYINVLMWTAVGSRRTWTVVDGNNLMRMFIKILWLISLSSTMRNRYRASIVDIRSWLLSGVANTEPAIAIEMKG